MRVFATPKDLARSAITAALALPLSAGALTATLSAGPSGVSTTPTIASREALGCTLRVTVTPPDKARKKARRSSTERKVRYDPAQDQLEQIDDQEQDDRRQVEIAHHGQDAADPTEQGFGELVEDIA